MINVGKNVTNEHMGSKVKFNIFLMLFTNENIFMSKIIRKWLKNCAPVQFLLLEIACGAIFDKVLYKIPYYCSPPSLFGHVWRLRFNKHSEYMGLKKTFLINNVFKHFMYTVLKPFHDECLKNISSITFISSK